MLPEADFGPFAITSVQATPFELTALSTTPSGMPWARVGEAAPNFSLPTIGSTTRFTLAQERGRSLVLLFSCGCVPCEDVARGLTALPGRGDKLDTAVIVINPHVATPAAVKDFRQRSGYLEERMLADDGNVGVAYSALHCPKLWLIAPNGIARWAGGGDGDRRSPAELLVALNAVLARPKE